MIQSPRWGHAGFRPLYCQGGPALIRLQQTVMPLVDCDIPAVRNAYEPEFLAPLLETNANVFYLMFSPGWDAETEKPFHDAFARAAEYLHTQGCEAVACVSAGHAHARGGPDKNAWQAARGRGKHIPSWIPGFRMACWSGQDWRNHVRKRALAALDSGADGVCLDTVIFGASPAILGPRIIGPAGCSCNACRQAFLDSAHPDAQSVASFPPHADKNPEAFFRFAHWRAQTVAECVSAWADAIREKNPEALVAANLLHPEQANAALIFGADTALVAPHLDVVLSETGNLINFEKTGLTYDGATQDLLRLHASGRDVAALPWHAGPHIESEPRAALWRAALSEAAACGAALAPHVSVMVNPESLAASTLAMEAFQEHRKALGVYWSWVDHSPEVFVDLEPWAPVALAHDRRAWRRAWSRTAPAFLKMYATMAELHVPFQVIDPTGAAGIPEHVKVLVLPPALHYEDKGIAVFREFATRGLLLFLGDIPEWAPPENRANLDAEIFAEPVPRTTPNLLHGLAGIRHNGSPAPYMQHRSPAPGAAARLLRTHGRFLIPEQWKTIFDTIQNLRAAAGDKLTVEAPPYLSVRLWRNRSHDRLVVHAANLLPGFPGPRTMRLDVPGAVSSRILTPDRNRITYIQESSFTLEIITCAAIEMKLR